MKPLRICIDARLIEGTAGGLEPVISGLASGLSKLEGGDEEYLFLAYRGSENWLLPNISKQSRMLYCKTPLQQRVRMWINKFNPVIRRDLWSKFIRLVGWQRSGKLPYSDGTIENNNVDLMHFTRQDAFLTNVPSIYHPHDLLHKHFPGLFNQSELDERELRYHTFCEQAKMVAVTASWGKNDLIKHYNLPMDKVHVVPWAPAQYSYRQRTDNELIAVKGKYSLPESFIFYPAQTWPHKNHIGLLNAIAILRKRDKLTVSLICSGRLTEHYSTIKQHVRELKLSEQVRFLGYVDSVDLQSIYMTARCIVIPTFFEAASSPLWEAFVSGVPAACSNITSLPHQAQNAALLFNPNKPEEIADAIYQLWTDNSLRMKLVSLGENNVSRFSWKQTALTFRAHYRRLSKRSLTEEDCHILDSDPIL